MRPASGQNLGYSVVLSKRHPSAMLDSMSTVTPISSERVSDRLGCEGRPAAPYLPRHFKRVPFDLWDRSEDANHEIDTEAIALSIQLDLDARTGATYDE